MNEHAWRWRTWELLPTADEIAELNASSAEYAVRRACLYGASYEGLGEPRPEWKWDTRPVPSGKAKPRRKQWDLYKWGRFEPWPKKQVKPPTPEPVHYAPVVTRSARLTEAEEMAAEIDRQQSWRDAAKLFYEMRRQRVE